LDISRIEQGIIKLKPEPTQLVDIVDNILKESSSAAQKRDIRIEFTKPTQSLPELNVDAQYTHEIFENIISNAIKYTKDKVTMSFEKNGNNILFVCSDNGIGIPKNEQSKIFSKFYVASNANKTGIKGTGIGLSAAKALIERMNGKIWFESEENKETTFYLSFPQTAQGGK
jgi:signal transduction histidine kinase